MNVTSGPSYWLPDSVEPAAYSGIGGGEYFDDAIPDYAVIWRGWDWYEDDADNPGVYNWTPIDNILTNNAALGKTVELRPVTGSRSSSEAAFYHVPEQYESYLSEVQIPNTTRFQANVWHPVVASAYNNFISALGARYADDDRIESVLIHGLSRSAGDEFLLEPSTDIQALADAFSGGDTDALRVDIQQWIEKRMDAYAAAFEGQEHKVVWVGHNGDKWSIYMSQTWPAWQTMNVHLIDYALNLGFGVRGGTHTKCITCNLYNDTFGFSVDADGYQLVDDSGDQFDGRYLGEETEAVYGDDDDDAERLRLSVYRGLQMRATHIYVSTDPEVDTDTYTIDPDLWDYCRLGLGKTVETTSEAWAVLWEQDISDSHPQLIDGGDSVIRNYERWLIQRDVTGGVTVPAEFHASTNGGAGFGWEVAPYGFYTARRTDEATGNSRIFFQADVEFAIDVPIRILVECYESAASTWCIEYHDGDEVTGTETYTTSADSKIRTAYVDLDGIQAGGLSNGYDFAIKLDDASANDVTVRMVRVVQRDEMPVSINAERADLTAAFTKTASLSVAFDKTASLTTTLREDS